MRVLAFLISVQIVCYGCGQASNTGLNANADVRQPAVAGQFYPSDSATLARAVEYYLEDAVAPSGDRPIAIIAPHAGYIYSGQIAADAFKSAAGSDYDLVVLLGTNHTTAEFRGVSIYPSGGFKTPMGTAEIDAELADRLIAADEDFSFLESVHTREHSIEVQVPFVLKLFPGAKILPAVIGAADLDLSTRFGAALAEAIKGRRALIVASSDLSHYPDFSDARRVDRKTLEAIARLDTEALHSAIQDQLAGGVPNLSTCACGEGPILAAIVAAKTLGARSARVISYANSGETLIGTRSRVVGYGAVAISAEAESASSIPFPDSGLVLSEHFALSTDHKKTLLTLARKAIRQYLTAETAPLPRGFGSLLEQQRGAFVTLKENGNLRGCIGHMAEDLPLCQVVGYCALQAAFNDQRFPPVRLEELDDIEIEISILTPYQRAAGYNDIQIGRDGVLLQKDGRSAVYLPSVPVEQGWDRDQMLDHLCIKAGLSPGDWKTGTEFYTFQALVFGESDAR
jgi:AmmeMemoRadiSam system protein B/AmmeMemoRadiSam system protein A